MQLFTVTKLTGKPTTLQEAEGFETMDFHGHAELKAFMRNHPDRFTPGTTYMLVQQRPCVTLTQQTTFNLTETGTGAKADTGRRKVTVAKDGDPGLHLVGQQAAGGGE